MYERGGDPMKSRLPVIALAILALSAPCFASAVHLTGDISADFLGPTSADQIITTFTVGDQPLLCGVGWEVILDRVGLGGTYMVDFFQDASSVWWLDWYAPALFLSFHPLGANWLLDPFAEVGIGSAGRVRLGRGMMAGASEPLALSLFPWLAAGLSLNLDALLLSAKVSWTPYNFPIPVTSIPAYPLGTVQVTVAAGIAIGW
jgi:hypothetical protein